MLCQGLVTDKLDRGAKSAQPQQVPPLPHVDVELSMVLPDVLLQIQLCQANQLSGTGLDPTLECFQEVDIVWDENTCSYQLLIIPHMFSLHMLDHLLIVNHSLTTSSADKLDMLVAGQVDLPAVLGGGSEGGGAWAHLTPQWSAKIGILGRWWYGHHVLAVLRGHVHRVDCSDGGDGARSYLITSGQQVVVVTRRGKWKLITECAARRWRGWGF